MDPLVIDCSVAVKWFVPEVHSAEARRILAEYQGGQLALLAPDLISPEVGNVLWKKHRLQGLAYADAESVVDELVKVEFDITPTAALLPEALRLAVDLGRTVYDACYLALSIRRQCRFVTADERLVNAVAASLPQVIWLPTWP